MGWTRFVEWGLHTNRFSYWKVWKFYDKGSHILKLVHKELYICKEIFNIYDPIIIPYTYSFIFIESLTFSILFNLYLFLNYKRTVSEVHLIGQVQKPQTLRVKPLVTSNNSSQCVSNPFKVLWTLKQNKWRNRDRGSCTIFELSMIIYSYILIRPTIPTLVRSSRTPRPFLTLLKTSDKIEDTDIFMDGLSSLSPI